VRKIAKEYPPLIGLDYEDMLQGLPEERREELENKKKDFSKKAGIAL